MLLMLGLYSLAVKVGVPVVALASGLARCLRWRLPRCGSGNAAAKMQAGYPA
jgi:hypothetical protein